MIKGITLWNSYGYVGGPLDADFLEFYNKDIFEEKEKDQIRTFRLISQLPERARITEYILGGKVFSHTDSILAMIELWSHAAVWDGKGDKPELMLPEHIKNIQKVQSMTPEEKKAYSLSPEEIHQYIYGDFFD